MINIFSLFLVLFFTWIALIASNNLVLWSYLALGFIASFLISIIAWKIKIINHHSKFLFLNWGFYRHFAPLFLSGFSKSLFLIINTSFSTKKNQSILYYFPIKKQNDNSELLLFFLSITLIPGLLYLGVREGKIIIHALDKKYFDYKKLNKIYNNLYRINDDRLVEEKNDYY